MEGRKKVLTYLYIYACAILILLVWLFSLMKNKEVIHYHFDIESLGLTVIGLLSMLILIFIEDSFFLGVLLLLTPFSFAREFDIANVPPCLYLVLAFALIGMILHLFIYRTRIKRGTYFISLLLFCIGTTLGGLINSSVFLSSFFTSLGLSVAIMFFYIYIVSYLGDHSFNELCHIMLAIGIVLILQTVLYQKIINPDTMFLSKDAHYGWACTNNLALMLLFTFPFGIYLTINSKNIFSLFASIIVVLEAITIMMNYSRGATFVMFIMLPICIIYAFIKSKTKLWFALYYVITLFVAFIIFVLIASFDRELFDAIWANVFHFNISTLNGRKDVYIFMLEESKNHIFFGKGLLSTMNIEIYRPIDPNSADNYMWAHNTFIHVLFISGIFGLVCFLGHLYTKYKKLLIDANPKKMTIMFAFLISGFYGLMDISYYYIIYMVVLIVVMALIEKTINKEEISDEEM